MHNHFCLAGGYGNNVELEIAAVIKVSFFGLIKAVCLCVREGESKRAD